ncbi:histidine phosphatase family protein [Herbiconiux liangxiaofengii]|uniref:histidine phosphatase family protein n=1 Tax=Herbiconiux liangxiaofengii TaxID=3342795 RepID=UPI0035B77259
MSARQIHLVRHGEVFNPNGVLYGRIPGFGLSELGHRMAASAAADLVERDRPIAYLYTSPLQRARESGRPIAEALELEPAIEDRIIEPTNAFEGRRMSGPGGALRDPRMWRFLWNPWLPAWGEHFTSIAARMRAAMTDAHGRAEASGVEGDIVMVSHQLPIWMAHRSIVGEALPHDPRKRRCALSSITSFELRDGRLVEVGYTDPAAGLQASATDVGAV